MGIEFVIDYGIHVDTSKGGLRRVYDSDLGKDVIELYYGAGTRESLWPMYKNKVSSFPFWLKVRMRTYVENGKKVSVDLGVKLWNPETNDYCYFRYEYSDMSSFYLDYNGTKRRASPPSLNTWHYYELYIDYNEAILYVDGSKYLSVSISESSFLPLIKINSNTGGLVDYHHSRYCDLEVEPA